MARNYIHSTCGQTQVFKFFSPRNKGSTETTSKPLMKNGKPVEIKIEGGAYVLMKHEGRTRKVAITEVTDEELVLLNSHPAYCRMKQRGFLTEHTVGHIEKDSKGNPMDMEIKDGTSQISDEDHATGKDERLNHAATRATAGINNQEAGMQPVGSQEGSYGPIYL